MSHKASLPCISAFAAATLAGIGPALAAVTVGLRLSPVALTVDNPGVDDELSLPSFTYMTNPDGSVQYDFSGE
jgi:hypothetical protein